MITELLPILCHLGPSGLAKALSYATLTVIAKTFGIKTIKKNVSDYRSHLDTSDKDISHRLFLLGQREIGNNHAINLICKVRGLRTALLEKTI